MRLNTTLSVLDKITALQALPQLSAVSSANRLFFAARNLAIEVLELKIAALLSTHKHVQVRWVETSCGNPVLSIDLLSAKPSPACSDDAANNDQALRAQVSLLMTRKVLPGARDAPSYLFYRANGLRQDFPTRRRSQAVERFFTDVQALWDDQTLQTLVFDVNYPFAYNNRSSF